MGRKIFVSYKYSDNLVQTLYQLPSLYQAFNYQTTARDYVNKLVEILEEDDHIYKGEDDGQSLADFSDEYIASKLRDKIYDSSITIVLISKGMKDTLKDERNQWIPWEISYSLRETSREGRTSLTNGVIALVLPDEYGSYDYYLSYDSICQCTSLNTSFLFQIIRDNIFNQKNPVLSTCINGSVLYHGDSSYIISVKWEDFRNNPNLYLDKAIEIQNKKEEYFIMKTVK